MVVCFIALGVFSILGLFSLKYRRLAGEAFDCVFRRLTFRPCVSRLDERIKAKIVSKILPKSPSFARLVARNFELLSWIFVILSLASFFFAAQGAWNFYRFGNCNGPNDPGFCIFDPAGEGQKYTAPSNSSCAGEGPSGKPLSMEGVDVSIFPSVGAGKNTVIFIGCFSCEYTRKAYPTIRGLAERQDVRFVFAHLPVKDQNVFSSNAVNCAGDRFLQLSDEIFSIGISEGSEGERVLLAAKKIGLDTPAFRDCVNSTSTSSLSERQLFELKKTGVYGTPTVFINGEAIVGPKPERVYSLALGG